MGLGGALGLSTLISGLLYGVSERDPGIYAAAATLMALVTLLACLIPARRASELDAAVAPRHQ
jgi:ABC-type lipoprotein release transport system permease subunit